MHDPRPIETSTSPDVRDTASSPMRTMTSAAVVIGLGQPQPRQQLVDPAWMISWTEVTGSAYSSSPSENTSSWRALVSSAIESSFCAWSWAGAGAGAVCPSQAGCSAGGVGYAVQGRYAIGKSG